MVVDGLTKDLPTPGFSKFRCMISIYTDTGS